MFHCFIIFLSFFYILIYSAYIYTYIYRYYRHYNYKLLIEIYEVLASMIDVAGVHLRSAEGERRGLHDDLLATGQGRRPGRRDGGAEGSV